MNRIFHLSFIQGELKSNGITSVLIDGALLGLIREGNLIGWDWDAEIAILDQDFNFQAFERTITNLIRNRFESLVEKNEEEQIVRIVNRY